MVSRSSSTASAVNFPEKIQTALRALEDCRMCPRDCGVNRLENRWAACKTGRYAIVDCYFAHFGEEYCLRVGTVQAQSSFRTAIFDVSFARTTTSARL